MNRSLSYAVLVSLLVLPACEPADDVKVQPLPPLQRPSPEARAGLPEVGGAWRHAGWELAEDDSAGLESPLPTLGEIAIHTQRLDSVAGAYSTPGGRVPLVGEVRRDSVVALAAPAGGYFAAGRVARDTLWLTLTSLVEPGAWPRDARAAFVRAPVAETFARLRGQSPAVAPDTAPPAALATGAVPQTAPGLDTLPMRAPAAPPASAAGRADNPAVAAPVDQPSPTRPQPQPRATDRGAPPEPRAADTARPRAAEPTRDTATPRLPRLLGEPVRRDTTPDTTAILPRPPAPAPARPE